MIERIYPAVLRAVLKVFFRLLYHEAAWSYDLVASAVSAGHWSQWVRQAVPFVQGTRVLELGFGPGHMLVDLAAQDRSVYGLDRSRPMARQAAWRIKTAGRHTRDGYAQSPKLVQGLGSRLPFKNDCFETILATFPTEYIFEPATASEIFRTLSPGGRLVIVLTAWITGRSFRERASALLFRLSGQSEPWRVAWKTPFSDCGLEVDFKWLDLGHSRVCVLTADKI